MDWYDIWWHPLTTWTAWTGTIYDDTPWPHGHHELVRQIARHSDHMDTTNWYGRLETLWPHRAIMSDYVDTMNWYGIWWYTLTIWQTHRSHIRHSRLIAQHFDNMVNHIIISAFLIRGTMRCLHGHRDYMMAYVGQSEPTQYYGTLWPHEQYMAKHHDYMGNIWDPLWHLAIYGIRYDHVAIYGIHYDHVDGIDWCDIWRGLLSGKYMVRHADHMDSMNTYNNDETPWPHGQYMAIHTDDVNSTNQCNISWHNRPCRHYELVQHVAIHADHMDTMNWHGISWDTLTM